MCPQRERRYEPRERTRIQTLERAIARQAAMKEAEERDAIEMSTRLSIWDDDESDETFYIDRRVVLFTLSMCCTDPFTAFDGVKRGHAD